MVIYLYGDEEYLVHRKVQEYKKSYLEKSNGKGNVLTFDCGEKCDVYEICAMCTAQDLFVATKMLIIKNFIAHTKADAQKILQKTIETVADTVVFWESGMPRKNAFLAGWLMNNAHEIFEGKKLFGADLSAWIASCVQAQGARIHARAVDELILYVGSDLRTISQEIDKLISYAQGREIVQEDVQILVHGHIDADMFVTIEAIFRKDKGQALALLKKQLIKGDEPFHIFSMYAYQLRTLLLVGDASAWGKIHDRTVIAKKAAIHPFVVQKTVTMLRNMSQKDLVRLHRYLTILDREIKTGQRDVISALELFIMRVS